MVDAQGIIETLGLVPLEPEGGYFLETWRATERTPGGRALGTAIYYLLTPRTCSTMHRLPGDELFHFYLGDPVEILTLHPDGGGALHVLGTDLGNGDRPQLRVAGGVWQGARLVPGGRVALMGTTCAPGFDYADCEFSRAEPLVARWPAFEREIRARIRVDRSAGSPERA